MKKNEDTYSVCAVLVTFHPEPALLRTVLDSAVQQVQKLVIVDNSASDEVSRRLTDIKKEYGISLLTFNRNLGVGAAHNAGVSWAKERGFSHVLLLDQDSIPAEHMVERLLEVERRLNKNGLVVAAVGPRYLDTRNGTDSYFVQFGKIGIKKIYCGLRLQEPAVAVDILISSGMFIPIEAISIVGGMEEDLFIDSVDTEWCLRARAKGFKLYGVCDALMQHTLGDKVRQIWFGRWRRDVYLHSTSRQYYIMRNRVLLCKRPYTPKSWIVRDISRMLFRFILFSLLVPPRRKNVGMMIMGIKDGLANKTGPLN